MENAKDIKRLEVTDPIVVTPYPVVNPNQWE